MKFTFKHPAYEGPFDILDDRIRASDVVVLTAEGLGTVGILLVGDGVLSIYAQQGAMVHGAVFDGEEVGV